MVIKAQPVEVLQTTTGVWLKSNCWSCGALVERHIVALTPAVPWTCNACDVTWETRHYG